MSFSSFWPQVVQVSGFCETFLRCLQRGIIICLFVGSSLQKCRAVNGGLGRIKLECWVRWVVTKVLFKWINVEI